MTNKEVEIFSGNIGTVRNELNGFIKDVAHIISLTQSVSTTGGNTTPILTVVLVYVPWNENPEEVKNKPIQTTERYI
jgi:hypothetical protein